MTNYTSYSTGELRRLSQQDPDHLRREIGTGQVYNSIMNRPVNQTLLGKVKRLLNGKPIPRAKSKNGRVEVRKISSEEMERLWK